MWRAVHGWSTSVADGVVTRALLLDTHEYKPTGGVHVVVMGWGGVVVGEKRGGDTCETPPLVMACLVWCIFSHDIAVTDKVIA